MFRKSRYHFFVYLTIAIAPILFLSIGAVLSYIKNNPDILKIASYLPYSLLAVVSFLSLRLNQSRIFFTGFTFTLSFYLATTKKLPTLIQLSGLQMAQCLAFSVPIAIVLNYSFGEGRRWGLRNLFRLIATLSPFAIFIAIAKLQPTWFFELTNFDFISNQFLVIARYWNLPDLTLLGVLLYITAIPLIKDYYLRSFNFAVLASFIPIFYAFNAQGTLLQASFGFVIAGTVLQYAIFHLYWQKVYIDELTRIPNRRALDEELRTLGKQFAIGMVDIDHFKKFNDSFGHEEGDNVLRMVAQHLASESRFHAFRYGGEEFCLIFDGKTPDEVHELIERLRRKLAERAFYIRAPHSVRIKSSKKDRGTKHRTRTKVSVTISIGLAGPQPTCNTPEAVISAADRALYNAKEKGRNCVILAPQR